MTENHIDTKYCYIEDATKNPNWAEVYDSSNPETYEDADCKSERLYKDLLCICVKLSEKWEYPAFQYNIRETSQSLFDEEGTRYTSDFIGVNRTLAYMAGISDTEIVEYLKQQRTIGGHMLFPVGKYPTINQARGCNMLDRFDFTLAELREYFIYLDSSGGDSGSKAYSAEYSKQLGSSFERYKEWIKKFCQPANDGIQNFRNFINYWLLDMFVSGDEECKVISLAASDLEHGNVVYIERKNTEPYFPGMYGYPKRVINHCIESVLLSMSQDEKENVLKSFQSYIKNTNYVIGMRNKKIEELF